MIKTSNDKILNVFRNCVIPIDNNQPLHAVAKIEEVASIKDKRRFKLTLRTVFTVESNDIYEWLSIITTGGIHILNEFTRDGIKDELDTEGDVEYKDKTYKILTSEYNDKRKSLLHRVT